MEGLLSTGPTPSSFYINEVDFLLLLQCYQFALNFVAFKINFVPGTFQLNAKSFVSEHLVGELDGVEEGKLDGDEGGEEVGEMFAEEISKEESKEVAEEDAEEDSKETPKKIPKRTLKRTASWAGIRMTDSWLHRRQ